MSEPAIRQALEVRLLALTPAIDTVLENGSMSLAAGSTQGGGDYAPVNGRPYQRVNLMRAQPANPEAGTFQQAQGILQITLEYPQNVGPGVAEARAAALAAWFPRGLSLTASGVIVTINKASYIMAGFVDVDRWAVPVRVFYYSNIS